MNEKYTRLFLTEKNIYTPTSPVIISAGALLKDNETGRVIVQLKLKNISHKEIRNISVKLTLLDSADRVIEDDVEYTYLDLKSVRDAEIGHKEPIFLMNSNVRAFKAEVNEVVFADKSIWNSKNAEWKSIGEAKQLLEYLKDTELVEQYSIDCGKKTVCVPRKTEDIWDCTCGAINLEEENICHICGLNFKRQVENMNIESLKSRLEQRKIETAYNAGVIEMECGESLEPCSEFEFKLAIEKFKLAIEKFESVKDFKDSKQKIELCNLKIEKVTEEIKKKREAEQIRREYKAGLRKKQLKRFAIISTSVVAICVVAVILLNTIVAPIYRKNLFEKYKNMVFAGKYHTIGLKSDGTVVATGNNEYGQCNVDNWDLFW